MAEVVHRREAVAGGWRACSGLSAGSGARRPCTLTGGPRSSVARMAADGWVACAGRFSAARLFRRGVVDQGLDAETDAGPESVLGPRSAATVTGCCQSPIGCRMWLGPPRRGTLGVAIGVAGRRHACTGLSPGRRARWPSRLTGGLGCFVAHMAVGRWVTCAGHFSAARLFRWGIVDQGLDTEAEAGPETAFGPGLLLQCRATVDLPLATASDWVHCAEERWEQWAVVPS